MMFNLSENYQLRQCFLKRDQAPTISVIKKKMTAALAKVYFDSMTPSLKVIAGLEPPLKGGGSDWFMPPEELLKGRAVLKPLNKKYMSQWRWNGIDAIGMRLHRIYRNKMQTEGHLAVAENDMKWPEEVNRVRLKEWHNCSVAASHANTAYIKQVIEQFRVLYMTSLDELQTLLFDAAVKEIKIFRNDAFKKMQVIYEDLLRKQAIIINDKYTKKLSRKKADLRNIFIQDLTRIRSALGDKLHDINVEKHVAVEKLRHYLECQALACQVYVAMKERQECAKEHELKKTAHTKITDALTNEINYKEFKILLAKNKEQKCMEFETMWKKKVSHVVKSFQKFVSYSLNMLPEHAEFFLNMETLMMLQLSEAVEHPSIDSIFTMDEEPFYAPVPRPHPFYLVCDKRHKPIIDQNLCPKHCTSSASQMPVVIVNKRCIYASCDNFEQFTDKIKDYINGKFGEITDFKDYHDYTRSVPVKTTSSQIVQELKLESSIFQLLQQEIANARKVSVRCPKCRIPQCFGCDQRPFKFSSIENKIENKLSSLPSIQPFNINCPKWKADLGYEREPKWESYSRYILSNKCNCSKLAKKHLLENLPIYMRKMSYFEEPELFNYEKCSNAALKSLVKQTRGIKTPPPRSSVQTSKTKDIATQCSSEFHYLCTCFSSDSIQAFFNDIKDKHISYIEKQFDVVGASVSPKYLTKETKAFATERAFSLRHLIDHSQEIKEIFKTIDYYE